MSNPEFGSCRAVIQLPTISVSRVTVLGGMRLGMRDSGAGTVLQQGSQSALLIVFLSLLHLWAAAVSRRTGGLPIPNSVTAGVPF
jgi:hypothetical protein